MTWASLPDQWLAHYRKHYPYSNLAACGVPMFDRGILAHEDDDKPRCGACLDQMAEEEKL